MRIVEINMMHTGSTGKIMFGIADCARKAGHQVWTFSPYVYQVSEKMESPEIEGHNYFGYRRENMLHVILAQLTGFHGCFSYFGTRQLIKKIDAVKPDVIHLHNLHNWTINLPMLFHYIKKNHINTVWTLHDCWSFTGQCPHFTMVKCEKWKTGCYHCPQIGVYPKSRVDRTRTMWKLKKKWFSGVENMVLVTPSQWLANLVGQSFLKEYSVKVIHNGIDLSLFQPRKSDFRQKYDLTDKKIVLGVSFEWEKRKGLDVFIKLANMLPSNYRIVLVGTTNQEDNQLPENVISIHKTNNQQELAEIYTAADVFAMPTREENYPTVNMEAIACGTPVVTFRTGGSPETIDETCGIVVPCDDVEAMKDELIRVCETKIFTKQSCLKRAECFDMRCKFKKYITIYEDSAHRP